MKKSILLLCLLNACFAANGFGYSSYYFPFLPDGQSWRNSYFQSSIVITNTSSNTNRCHILITGDTTEEMLISPSGLPIADFRRLTRSDWPGVAPSETVVWSSSGVSYSLDVLVAYAQCDDPVKIKATISEYSLSNALLNITTLDPVSPGKSFDINYPTIKGNNVTTLWFTIDHPNMLGLPPQEIPLSISIYFDDGTFFSKLIYAKIDPKLRFFTDRTSFPVEYPAWNNTSGRKPLKVRIEVAYQQPLNYSEFTISGILLILVNGTNNSFLGLN